MKESRLRVLPKDVSNYIYYDVHFLNMKRLFAYKGRYLSQSKSILSVVNYFNFSIIIALIFVS